MRRTLPHHVPKEWIAKYKGKFDQGWDKLREETLARQKQLGVVPADTKLAPKPAAIKDWDTLSADEKKLFAHQMEVFAGYGEYADYEIGRLVQAIEDLGQMDNTLIFYIVGDNGASAEGRHERPVQRDDLLQRRPRDRRGHPQALRRSGRPNVLRPLRRRVGRRRGYAVHLDEAGRRRTTAARATAWSSTGPSGIKAKGEVRSQWHHVIDIAPTILEAAGLPEPRSVNGTPQTPIEGVSMLYTFDDARAKDRHTTQYFEIFGNRAIYHDGWLAGTVHRAAWEAKPRRRVSRTTSGSCTTSRRTSARRTIWPRRIPPSSRRCRTLFMKEAAKIPRLADRRPLARASQRRSCRAP